MTGSAGNEKKGFFRRLRDRLSGGGGGVPGFGWLSGRKLTPELAEELEERLLLSDTGVETTDLILRNLKDKVGRRGDDPDAVSSAMREVLIELLSPCSEPLEIDRSKKPFVVLMVGVNGSGKTTTIGKLARWYKNQGLSIMLAAGDTYRAAATEQLQVWGERNDVPVVGQQPGADPAAVVFDALEAATARGTDVVLADTAGRLQNQDGLMRELEKVVRVAGKHGDAPHEKMLVLDASLGQNAITQAKVFHEAIGLTGITMTKLDGGAKGGTLLALANELDVPFRFIGIGEQAEDMQPFDAEAFVDALLKPENPDA